MCSSNRHGTLRAFPVWEIVRRSLLTAVPVSPPVPATGTREGREGPARFLANFTNGPKNHRPLRPGDPPPGHFDIRKASTPGACREQRENGSTALSHDMHVFTVARQHHQHRFQHPPHAQPTSPANNPSITSKSRASYILSITSSSPARLVGIYVCMLKSSGGGGGGSPHEGKSEDSNTGGM